MPYDGGPRFNVQIVGASGGASFPPAAALGDNTANPTTTSVGAFVHWFDGVTWDRAPGNSTDGALVNLGTNNDVDTELPAAAAFADNTANPTAPAVGAFAHWWDGATWDRAPGDSTNGLLVNTEMAAAAVLADATANPTVPAVGSFMHAYNGATWDRLRMESSSQFNLRTAIFESGNMVQVRNLAADAEGQSRPKLLAANFAYVYNNTSYDSMRTANAASGTTGTGLLGIGNMGWDGAAWQRQAGDVNGAVRTRPIVSNKLALTVQAAAYAAADLVGGKLTFTSFARVSGGSALIKGILIGDQAANSAANSVYDLILFDSDPTGTTFTENSPLDVADADLNKIIGVVRFDGVVGTTLFTNADNQVIFKGVEIPITLSGSTSLFGALIARGSPTYAATTDVFITLLSEVN